MRYLLDSSTLLELLLGQANASDVQQLIQAVEPGHLCLSDFALHSIGVVLSRLNLPHIFARFVEDMVLSGFLTIVSIPPNKLIQLVSYQQQFGLDFDDGYQYTTAVFYHLKLVSLDADFDRTPEGRLTPRQALTELDSFG